MNGRVSVERTTTGRKTDKNKPVAPQGVTKINMWDGLPKIDFNETVMYPLNAGLASISLKNDSLFATALTRDAGGVLGIPAAGSPGIPANVVSEND